MKLVVLVELEREEVIKTYPFAHLEAWTPFE
jgi:hypothetical protein